MAEQSEIRYLNEEVLPFQEERYQVHRLQGSRVPEEVPQRAG